MGFPGSEISTLAASLRRDAARLTMTGLFGAGLAMVLLVVAASFDVSAGVAVVLVLVAAAGLAGSVAMFRTAARLRDSAALFSHPSRFSR